MSQAGSLKSEQIVGQEACSKDDLEDIKGWVRQAVTLDAQDKDYGKAWKAYLNSVLGICQCLLSSREVTDKREAIGRLYKIGGECLRRAHELHEVTPELIISEINEYDFASRNYCNKCSNSKAEKNESKIRQREPENSSVHGLRGSRPASLEQRHRQTETLNSLSKVVWQRDRAILKMYEERLLYMKPQVRSAFQLSLMRRMHENLDIARTKRNILNHKTNNTGHKLTEESSTKLEKKSSFNDLNAHDRKSLVSFEGKWFNTESLSKWMRNEDIFFRDRIRDQPINEELLSYFVLKFSSSRDHPLGHCLDTYMTKFQEIYGDKTRENLLLGHVLEDIHAFFENLYIYILEVYPEFGENEEAFLHTKTTIEHVVFTGISQVMLIHYHKHYAIREANFASKLQKLAENVTPRSLGVADKFCLMDEMIPSLSSSESEQKISNTRSPYISAIDEFRKTTNYRTPSGKLDCFVRTSDEICQSVVEYWKAKGINVTTLDEFAIGSDHLLPLFEYVILKSQVPFIFSEILFVEEFLPDRLLSGAEGFLVATLQTALNYLETVVEP